MLLHNPVIGEYVHPLAFVEFALADFLIAGNRCVKSHNTRIGICDRFAAYRAALLGDERMLVFAHTDLRRESEVDHTLRCHIIQHLPRRFLAWETVFDIDMCDAAAAAFLVEQTAEPAFFLDGAFLHQGQPLVTVNPVLVLLVQQVIRLSDHACAVFCRDHLNIE